MVTDVQFTFLEQNSIHILKILILNISCDECVHEKLERRIIVSGCYACIQ